jgi:hypothetical protein
MQTKVVKGGRSNNPTVYTEKINIKLEKKTKVGLILAVFFQSDCWRRD